MTSKRTEDLAANVLNPFAFWANALRADLANMAGTEGSDPGDLAALGEEFVSFVRKRLERDMSHAESLARCRSLVEAGTLQHAWLLDAFNDYSDEAMRMMSIANRLVETATVAPEDEARSRSA